MARRRWPRSQLVNRVLPLTLTINVHLERLQLSQSEGSKTIGQWYRRYLRIGWEIKFPSLIDLQD